MTKEEFEIPGMFITRRDIDLIVYRNHMTEEQAFEKALGLTDTQMNEIAETFAQTIFDGTDIFPKTLIDVVKCLEDAGVLRAVGE
jgi:hypothetical protein